MMKRSSLERTLELLLKAHNITGYEREYAFAKDIGRRWRFDFAWPKEKVAVEVEGGTWTYGRHNRPSGFEGDVEKYNVAAVRGWLVLRITSEMLKRPKDVISLVCQALVRRLDKDAGLE